MQAQHAGPSRTVEQPHHRPVRQDTFDLRQDLQHTGAGSAATGGPQSADGEHNYTSDTDHSVMEDDSSGEENDGEFIEDDDDGSSDLSVPNESIDFDLVYSLHTFTATVEGQASVVKGDSLFLMDDSNSYWWLVRVLKTQDVGYIPAENIETPYERLARLNKHRNVDLASATQEERQEDVRATRERMRTPIGENPNLATTPQPSKSVVFTGSTVYNYPPAVWGEERPSMEGVEGGEWDGEHDGSGDEYVDFEEMGEDGEGASGTAEPDDGMSWEDGAVSDPDASQGRKGLQVAARPHGSGSSPTELGSQSEPVHQNVQSAQQAPSAPQQQQNKAATTQSQLGLGGPSTLRTQTSRERIVAGGQPQLQESETPQRPLVAGSNNPFIDPAQAVETKQLSLTPSIAREDSARRPAPAPPTAGPLLPSTIMQQQQQVARQAQSDVQGQRHGPGTRNISAGSLASMGGSVESIGSKRSRDDGNESDVSDSSRNKKGRSRSDSKGSREGISNVGGGSMKLRKDRTSADFDESATAGLDEGKKKKSGGMFGSLFKKKDKKEKEGGGGAKRPLSSQDPDFVRSSEDSGRSSSNYHSMEGVVAAQPSRRAPDPKQQRGISSQGISSANYQPQVQPQQQLRPGQSPIAAQTLKMQQADQQQQKRYQEYLATRAPTSPVDAASSFGTQSAASRQMSLGAAASTLTSNQQNQNQAQSPIGPGSSSRHNRPGSLILLDSQAPVPELSVLRVFAGENLQSDATFKTVLLNTSTTASDLVRQAMQRFRLAHGEDEMDYYLTVKQLEGDEATLNPDEHPLGVFEQLVERSLNMPTVKRSSMGSISSLASNLSIHPAIAKLAMNDFTDDSAVKFYLNRKRSSREESDETVGEDNGRRESVEVKTPARGEERILSNANKPLLAVATRSMGAVSPERFSSPTARFSIQVAIHPEDLPDGVAFDPLTEAIVPRSTLQRRLQQSTTASASPGVSQTLRKKVFVFPKNTTVAEVIEASLERFGIAEGVVDGGDEVEDKLAKRRSQSRVRYGLAVETGDGQERHLNPSSKVLDAFPKPPAFKLNERRSVEMRRRSADPSQLLGSLEDIQPEDPMFILRRAHGTRTSISSRSKSSAPLDEYALQQLHNRESTTSSVASDYDRNGVLSSDEDGVDKPAERPQPPLSRQELIAQQRAASRANQRAILTAQANSDGSDIVLSKPSTPVTPPVGAGAKKLDPSKLAPHSGRDTATPSSRYPSAPSTPAILKDDFGLSHMLTIIQLGAAAKRKPPPPPLDPIDELLFGPTISMDELHPQARELYEPAFKQLEDMDRELDALLQSTFRNSRTSSI